jgi:hypothetical protein
MSAKDGSREVEACYERFNDDSHLREYSDREYP